VRVRENAESIAFYGGEDNEKRLLTTRLRAVVDNFMGGCAAADPPTCYLHACLPGCLASNCCPYSRCQADVSSCLPPPTTLQSC
jgi:hypothetical protein